MEINGRHEAVNAILRLGGGALLLFASVVARAEKSAGQEHFERACVCAKDGNHRCAVDELKLAYESDPRPALLYNLGVESEKLGDSPASVDALRAAVGYFRSYLVAAPDDSERAAIEARIADLVKRIPPDPPPPEPRPKFLPTVDGGGRQRAGRGLIIGGAALAVAGGICLGLFGGNVHEAAVDTTLADHDQHAAASQRYLIAGSVVGGMGVLAGLAGVIVLALPHRKSEVAPVAISPTGNGLVFSGRF